jgi:hypothetical protein
LIVRDLEFTGQVQIANTNTGSDIEFEDCHFLGGILDFSADPTTSSMSFRRCRIVGGASLQPEGSCVVDSCVFEGPLSVNHSYATLVARDSEFHGAGTAVAIQSGNSELQSATISRCTIERFASGIVVRADAITVEDNHVSDCPGVGMYLDGGASPVVRRNQLERCGGFGLYSVAYGSVSVLDNIVAGSGESGMLVVVDGGGQITGNVVSACGRNGIELHGYAVGGLEVRNNTSAFNVVSGFWSENSRDPLSGYELSGNIGFGNGAYGVQWQTPDASVVRCNDWFENGLGAVQGMPPSSEDFTVDPRFCNTALGDFHLSSASPLVSMPGCGQVGALGVGCGVLSTPDRSADASRLAAVHPSPARGPVSIEFELARQSEISLDVFDVQGRLVASLARGAWPAGRHAVEWCGSAGGTRAAAGVYLVRYRHPGGQEQRSLVLAR